MDTKNLKEPLYKYACEKCNFKCIQKCDWNRHLLRKKHLGNLLETKKLEGSNYSCICGKTFNSKSGFWKHKHKCKIQPDGVEDDFEEDDKTITPDLILSIIQQNQEFKDMLLEQNKIIIEMAKKDSCSTTNNNNIINNSNNKTFNLQVFLNETCKDAMNITDFVNSIQLQLTDFENIGEQGYVNGISNLIIKNLKALDENMRPVHCSDLKRESIYVKDNNQWEKDTNDNQKLKKAIKIIAHKNTKMIPKYREKYPDTQISSSKASDNYNRFVLEAMGGSGENDDEKTDKIVRRIAKEILINKE